MTLILQHDMLSHNEWHSTHQWRKTSFDAICAILEPPSDFPCYFSQHAFRKQNIVFIFIESTSDEDLSILSVELGYYLQRCDQWDGTIATAEPLLVLFNPDRVRSDSVAGYHSLGWQILQYLHEHDPFDWPTNVARDPNKAFWSMCYRGVQLFVNMSNPAHKQRLSRNLGDSLCFVINPRERFDIVAGNDEHGWRVRRLIRDRVHAYDGIEHCPQLGSYNAGEIEWWQYGIFDTNVERQDSCPFVMKR